MKQKYECEKCGVESHITIEDHADFYTVFKALLDDHRKWSPKCDVDIYRIKVFREQGNSADGGYTCLCGAKVFKGEVCSCGIQMA